MGAIRRFGVVGGNVTATDHHRR